MVYWEGGDTAIEAAALEKTDFVIGYGSDKTSRALEDKVRLPAKLLCHGHKLSFAVVGAEQLTGHRRGQAAAQVATDVSALDQQGCLSPHMVFVEADASAARGFAQDLADEMVNHVPMVPVEEIIIELERAWNAGDGAAWAASFSEDADFVDVVARVQHGRDIIAKEHQKIVDTIYQGSLVEFRQVTSRTVGDDVLLVHTTSTLRVPTGPRAGDTHSIQTMILQKGGSPFETSTSAV